MKTNPCWISCPPEAVVPVVVKTFTLNRPTEGEIRVTGLGFFRLTVNGKRVTDDLFTPAITDYVDRDKRRWLYPLFDETTHRIRYMRYNIGPYLQEGENRFELTLAPGWWKQDERLAEGDMTFCDRLIGWFDAEIQTAEGKVRICTDGSEQWRPSERTYCNLFIGEEIDANFRADEAPLSPVAVFPTPDAVFEAQTCPSDGVIRTIEPKLIKSEGGVSIYDCGENITGVAEVTAGGRKGDRVELRFSEEITSDSALDFTSTGPEYICRSGRPQIQTDVFTLSDEDYVFTPEFVWHGFRYIEVRGAIKSICVKVIHTRAAVTSALETSSEGLAFLYDAYVRTQLDNLHGCIPSDCPHRERLGYTGDGQVTARTAMTLLDAKGVYRKWIQDILDCQDIISGHVQHTAPAMGGGGGPGGWGCAMITVPDEYYRHYGDLTVLQECYPHMKAWIGYLKAHSIKGIVMTEEEGGWCLGDWAALGAVCLPIPFVNTCCVLDSLNRMERIAGLLGYTADQKAYAAYKAKVKQAMRNMFYEAVSGSWVGGTQGADAFAVWCGLDEDGRALKNLVERYKKLGVFDTGFVGTAILSSVLTQAGEADLLYELLTTEKLGSYLYMKRAGATTIWEHFNDESSHNHHMFGAPARHIFDGFLGIGQAADSVGYEKPEIAPKLPAKADRIKGTVTLPVGAVTVDATRTAEGVNFGVTVPVDNVPFIYGGKTVLLQKGFTALSYKEWSGREA